MKFSIVTISFNQREYIERTICSVLEQVSDVDLEYIVIDAGSTDGSREIIKKYENQITHIVFEEDEGPADGLNKGFGYATGEIYGYVNADDVLIAGTLRQVNDYFVNNNIDIVSGHGFVINENDEIIHRCFSHKFDLANYAKGNAVLVQPSTFFTSYIFNRIQGFNVNNKISWDGELMVDMALKGAKFHRANKYWSKFRVYDSSISGSGDYLNEAKIEHERISNKIAIGRKYNSRIICNKLIYRISDPYVLFYRIIDGVVNGKRIIPK